MTKSKRKKLLDSCIWVSFVCKTDFCHQEAGELIGEIPENAILVFDHIYAEVLNVLRKKHSDYHCHIFQDLLITMKTRVQNTNLSPDLLKFAEIIFYLNKKLSFTDALLVAIAKAQDAELITFDKNLQKAWQQLSN